MKSKALFLKYILYFLIIFIFIEPISLAILTLWVSATRSAFAPLHDTHENGYSLKSLSYTKGRTYISDRCPDVDDIDNLVTFPSVSDCAAYVDLSFVAPYTKPLILSYRYYICSEGTPLIFRCLGDLEWNAIMQECDLPENVDCLNGERPMSTTPPETTEDPLITTNAPDADIDCPLEIGIHTFPHPFDCTRYYMCADKIPYPRSCPPDLLFNPEIGGCDFKENMLDKCELN